MSETEPSHQRREPVWHDASFVTLAVANVLTMVLAVYHDWNILTLLSVYWCQSVTIGVVYFFRILLLRNYTTKGARFAGREIRSGVGAKIMSAFFFVLHYGGFHAFYLLFILLYMSQSGASFESAFLLSAGVSILGFAANDLFSLIYTRRQQGSAQINIGKLMFYPYLRIIPMHLALMAAAFLLFQSVAVPLLVFFLILKTAADLVMHVYEERFLKTV